MGSTLFSGGVFWAKLELSLNKIPTLIFDCRMQNDNPAPFRLRRKAGGQKFLPLDPLPFCPPAL